MPDSMGCVLVKYHMIEILCLLSNYWTGDTLGEYTLTLISVDYQNIIFLWVPSL